MSIMQLGAQLYTLREYTQNLKDFSDTLSKVAEIGYKTVQVSGTCKYEPEWLKEQLKKTGLKCVLTHFDPVFMQRTPHETAELHQAFDCKYIGIGSLLGGINGYDTFVKNFMNVSQIFSEYKCYLMYHNHDSEFTKSDDGRLYLQRMADDFPAELLGFTLDTYWIQAGGADPAVWIENLAGRVPCIHLKDMSFDNGIKMAPVYEGNMNFDSILYACEDANVKYLLVEQDDCYGENPFDCLKRSYKNLNIKGLY